MKLPDKVYDVLSWVGKTVLPALAVLYSTLGETWGFPYINEIPTTIMALDVFLNVLLGISSNNYYKASAEETSKVVDPYQLVEEEKESEE